MAGIVYGWGVSIAGDFIYGDETDKRMPLQMGSASWKKISANQTYATLGIREDGTLWGYGKNQAYVLGLSGNGTTRYYWEQVGADSDWASITTDSFDGSYGIKTDGSLWTWGYNNTYQLGHGNTTTVQIPTKVGAQSWLKVASSWGSTLAIRADGTLWACGGNYYGQLGTGDNATKTTLTQVGSSDQWVDIVMGARFALGIQADGSLWSWGQNDQYQLGHGDTTTRYSPVRVGSATWKKVTATTSDYPTVFAIAQDNSLWGWGRNRYGELGAGNSVTVQSPTQVDGGTDWSSICLGYYHSVALKTDGTMWVCGNDNYTGTEHNDYNSLDLLLARTQIADFLADEIFASIEGTFFIIRTDKFFWTNFSGQTEIL